MHTPTPGRCGLLLSATVLLSACASVPSKPPNDSLTAAQCAITQADQVVGQASQLTPSSQSTPLEAAKQRLEKARDLVDEHKVPARDYPKARWLAQEATLDARLAQSRAEAQQAQAQNAALKERLGMQQGGGGQ